MLRLDDDHNNVDDDYNGDGNVFVTPNGAGLRTRKRPLGVGRYGDHPMDAGSGKRGKPSPPRESSPSLQATAQNSKTKGVTSWLALRRALHERYRDSEEHRAAEQTAADATERGWGLGGLRSKGGRGGWEGDEMSPGLRWVKLHMYHGSRHVE